KFTKDNATLLVEISEDNRSWTICGGCTLSAAAVELNGFGNIQPEDGVKEPPVIEEFIMRLVPSYNVPKDQIIRVMEIVFCVVRQLKSPKRFSSARSRWFCS